MIRNPRSAHIHQKQGKFLVDGLGEWHVHLRDPYHFLLAIPWTLFILLLIVAYVAINSLFALLYLKCGDCIGGARVGAFSDAFFFSVHTFGSIGYGTFTPKNQAADIIVTIEAICSLLMLAMVTGLSYARFAKPTTRLIFSRHAVIGTHNNTPTFMFRVANERRNQILDATIRVYMLRDEITAEGSHFYRVHELLLKRSNTANLTLTWTVLHYIDETSPLYGISIEQLRQEYVQFVISVSGIDDVTAYQVNARHVYGIDDILMNHRLKDVIIHKENGDRFFDGAQFHKVEKI